ncbi:2-phosphoxylose phosphatase 1-like [Branchiostoma lanceolatum]|uniref:2-phosphoxylose phosphatase 1-like n=1 Tax=Branchiostoma lanceolatum TaxID=7740 RepID=UPI003455CAB1
MKSARRLVGFLGLAALGMVAFYGVIHFDLAQLVNLKSAQSTRVFHLNTTEHAHPKSFDVTTPNDAPAQDMPEVVRWYCNTPKALEGEEGQVPEGFRLKAVFVVTRHGDRVPMETLPNVKYNYNSWTCKLDPDKWPSDPQISSFVKSAEKLRRSPNVFRSSANGVANMPPYPNSAGGPSRLTQTGVVQLLRVGEKLRRAYIDSKLLTVEGVEDQFTVITTPYSRTYQSATALMYGVLQDDLSKIRVHQENNVLFCGASCQCPLRNEYMKQFKSVDAKRFHEDPEFVSALETVAKTLDSKIANVRFKIIDALFGHVCNRLELPCTTHTQACLEREHARNVLKFINQDEQQRRESFNNYSRLAIQPLLSSIAKRMERLAEEKADFAKFVVYSGHDMTMTPLLSVLGLTHARWVPYASHVVMEMWERDRHEEQTSFEKNSTLTKPRKLELKQAVTSLDKTFVRFVHMGRDVTDMLEFCAGKLQTKLCPLEEFVNFVEQGVFQKFGKDSYREACRP